MKTFTIDEALILRDVADGAEAATVAETGVTLDVLRAGTFHVVIDVTALDTADADETYTVSVETDSVAAFSDSPVEVASVAVTSTGRYVLTVDSDLVNKLDSDAAAIRSKVTIAGTTPSITYGAFVAPVA